MATPRILWADDEIDLLKPHIRFLNEKGYSVTPVTNGSDALDKVKAERFDMVFLDEQMPGLGGLETLSEIKSVLPDLPVVMITKSEEESLMEDAIGAKIADYLIKPVNPKQILLACKKILDAQIIIDEKTSQNYLQQFGGISMMLNDYLSPDEWVEVYQKLVSFDMQLDGDEGARQILDDQIREAKGAFVRYIEENYSEWINETDPNYRPVFSHDVLPHFVFPKLGEKPVFFLLIDCMRYDQWLEFEKLLYPYFSIDKDFHYSILPTATPYSRNAIFSGLRPIDLAKRFPNEWKEAEGDEHSKNRYEEIFLEDLIERNRLNIKARYEKIVGSRDGRELLKNLPQLFNNDLNAIVINFVDILAHSRSDNKVLKEIAPDEKAYRALTRTWFEHSWLLEVFKRLAEKDCTVIVTSDHGALRALRDTKVIGDRETSTSLRYKYGRNLKGDPRHAIHIKNPKEFALPEHGVNTHYLIAKEDYYFVYPTNYHHYQNHYWDSMQHGGISMEEMLLPVLTLKKR